MAQGSHLLISVRSDHPRPFYNFFNENSWGTGAEKSTWTGKWTNYILTFPFYGKWHSPEGRLSRIWIHTSRGINITINARFLVHVRFLTCDNLPCFRENSPTQRGAFWGYDSTQVQESILPMAPSPSLTLIFLRTTTYPVFVGENTMIVLYMLRNKYCNLTRFLWFLPTGIYLITL